MILFPAIDLKDGACVRLLRGDMEAATVFNDSPADQARAFVEAGAQWLHIVDLNGAFDGESVNGDAVRAILDVTRAAGVRVTSRIARTNTSPAGSPTGSTGSYSVRPP